MSSRPAEWSKRPSSNDRISFTATKLVRRENISNQHRESLKIWLFVHVFLSSDESLVTFSDQFISSSDTLSSVECACWFLPGVVVLWHCCTDKELKHTPAVDDRSVGLWCVISHSEVDHLILTRGWWDGGQQHDADTATHAVDVTLIESVNQPHNVWESNYRK